MKVEERLLKYVSYWTTSDESCSDIPSSEREFTLAKALKQELETLGLTNILLTDHCYVYAKLPATPGMETVNPSALSLIWIPPRIFRKRCQTTDHSRL